MVLRKLRFWAATGACIVIMVGACATGGGRGDDDDATGGSGGTGNVGGVVVGGGGGGGVVGGGGGAPGCTESPCKLVLPQCGCDDGARCHFDGSTKVCATAGSKTSSDSCSGDCGAGMLCLDAQTGAGAICHEYCNQDSDCVGPGALCLLTVNDLTEKLCTHNCDPMTSTGCQEAAHKCDFYTETAPPNRTLTQCAGAGTFTHNQDCVDTSECAKGYGCFNTGGPSSVCLQWCQTQTPTCAVGVCNTLTPAIILNAVEYGACL